MEPSPFRAGRRSDTVAVSGMETKAGFIHVPFSHNQALEKPRPSMAQETINEAIRTALKLLLE